MTNNEFNIEISKIMRENPEIEIKILWYNVEIEKQGACVRLINKVKNTNRGIKGTSH